METLLGSYINSNGISEHLKFQMLFSKYIENFQLVFIVFIDFNFKCIVIIKHTA